MKLYTEEDVLKAAGTALLEPDEVLYTAERMVANNSRVIGHAIMERDFSKLWKMLRAEEKFAREKKAIEAWKKTTGAVWDSHRKKFIVWDNQ